MLVELINTPRPYAWGDTFSLAQWQGRNPSGQPEAELWLGTHPGSEAFAVNLDTGTSIPLSTWLGEQALEGSLPFLVKLLAAGMPLSIQVHPSKAQAELGFARENEQGIPVDSPVRNYRDPSDKPEIMIAWSERFEALAGFQSPQNMMATLRAIDAVLASVGLTTALHTALDGGVSDAVEWFFSGDDVVTELATAITNTVVKTTGVRPAEVPEDLWHVWCSVAPHFPGDPGIVVASFMNFVTVPRGQAIFIPAGVVHAYVSGFGLEVMAPSDNVLRGGLTPKNVDRAELSAVVYNDHTDTSLCEPQVSSSGVRTFTPEGVHFRVSHCELNGNTVTVDAMGPSVIVVESGQASYQDGSEHAQLNQGHAYLSVANASEPVTLTGTGSVYWVSAP
jgi:mannose-6-phosphate isomerase